MERQENAFTLVELLVVIAIIALLLSIVMPALNKVKESAQTLVCATNLKSYGNALHAYVLENNDYAPFMVSWLYSQKTIEAGESSGTIPKHCRWHDDSNYPDGSLWPYLSEKDVHMCPVFKRYANKLGLSGCPNSSQHSRFTRFSPNYSYSMNWFVGFDWGTYLEIGSDIMAKEISTKVSRITRAAECFAFSEENLWTIDASEWDEGRGVKTYNAVVLNDNALWTNANKTKPNGATDNIATYHKTSSNNRNDGQANVVYVDGHVETRHGLPGREAYENYGIPFPGHDSVNIW